MDIIERVEDQDKLLAQNSIIYLKKLTNIEELNVPTLKSLYRTKCRLMELRRHIFLSRERQDIRCHRCFMNFSEGPTEYKVSPAKLSDFAKKVLKKVKTNKFLTTFQRMYYKKLKKKFSHGFGKQNKMIITCSFCKKQTERRMQKPKTTLVVKKTITPAKKKRKSKKDKFCGLNASVVMQSTKKKNRNRYYADTISKETTACTFNKDNLLPHNDIQSNFNTTVSMTNSRSFVTSDFIPLDTNSKKDHKIKFSKKKDIVSSTPQPQQPEHILKAKAKLQKKNRQSLGNMLKKANENQGKNKNKNAANLKLFLASL